MEYKKRAPINDEDKPALSKAEDMLWEQYIGRNPISLKTFSLFARPEPNMRHIAEYWADISQYIYENEER